jgi:hypothetical protein
MRANTNSLSLLGDLKIMSALTVLIIRHAEKPDPDNSNLGLGLSATGLEDKHSLVIRGWQRAGAWTALFGAGSGAPGLSIPDVVYAADPDQSSSPDGSQSKRPFETVVPVCNRLHIRPITKYGVGDEVALVDEVRQLTGTVLICWEHKRIVDAILPELTKDQKLPHLPSKWDGSRFDVVLRFDRAQNGAPWSFRQLFPRLLAGDLDVPLSSKE